MKTVGQLIRINERGAARVLSGKAGMMFVVENWVGVNDRCAAVLDYRYPDPAAVGGFQCWTIEPEGFEIVREAPAPSPQRLLLALARLTDSFLECHGCFPLDNAKWKAAMTEAYALVGQPNTPARSSALADTEISSEHPRFSPIVGVIAQVEVPLERVVNAIIGALEGGYSPWMHAFQHTDTPATVEALAVSKDDADPTIWYARETFWRAGGQAQVRFDRETDEEGEGGGTMSVGYLDFVRGLNLMASNAPRHFADLVAENDDAVTHDVFMQMVVLGDIVYG